MVTIKCKIQRQSSLLMNLSSHVVLLWSHIQAVGDLGRLEAITGRWCMSEDCCFTVWNFHASIQGLIARLLLEGSWITLSELFVGVGFIPWYYEH